MNEMVLAISEKSDVDSTLVGAHYMILFLYMTGFSDKF